MFEAVLPTQFAAAERSTETEIRQQNQMIEKIFNYEHLFNFIPNIVLILNQNRQVVYYNQAVMNYLGFNRIEDVIGFRPGELMNCQFAKNDTGGCGTSEQCKKCGAVLAILTTIEQQTSAVRECNLLRKKGGETESLELRVWTDTISISEQNFIVFTIQNISDENRRKLLERIFFHDVRNTAGNIQGFSELLINTENRADIVNYAQIIHQLSGQLLDEISSQVQLTAAENNELRLSYHKISVNTFIERLITEFAENQLSSSASVQRAPDTDNVILYTDNSLLHRIVANMVKNAIEAAGDRTKVTIGCYRVKDRARFWVHNPEVIPRDIQLQMFKRSFSTKGKNRGLGTYSMKLLGEKYLKGQVSFASAEGSGTIFSLEVPLQSEIVAADDIRY